MQDQNQAMNNQGMFQRGEHIQITTKASPLDKNPTPVTHAGRKNTLQPLKSLDFVIEDSQTGKVTEAEAAKEETAEVPEADEEIKEIDVERS